MQKILDFFESAIRVAKLLINGKELINTSTTFTNGNISVKYYMLDNKLFYDIKENDKTLVLLMHSGKRVYDRIATVLYFDYRGDYQLFYEKMLKVINTDLGINKIKNMTKEVLVFLHARDKDGSSYGPNPSWMRFVDRFNAYYNIVFYNKVICEHLLEIAKRALSEEFKDI